MRRAVLVVQAALAVLVASSSVSVAQTAALSAPGAQPPAGATACLGCHAGAPNAMPSLKGLSASDIDAAMRAFRTGSREATVMDRIAKGFTEAETKAISAWLADAGAPR
jgi:cytochrome c553